MEDLELTSTRTKRKSSQTCNSLEDQTTSFNVFIKTEYDVQQSPAKFLKVEMDPIENPVLIKIEPPDSLEDETTELHSYSVFTKTEDGLQSPSAKFIKIEVDPSENLVEIKIEPSDDMLQLKKEENYESVEVKFKPFETFDELTKYMDDNQVPQKSISKVRSRRMSRRGGWNSASYKHNNRGRPRGLRGKDIGLYYRNLQMKKDKKNADQVMIHLTVPPAILSGLRKNIESIKKLAKECHIHVPLPKPLNVISVKQENESNFHQDESESNFVIPKSEKTYFDPEVLDGPSTSSISSNYTMESTENLIEMKLEPVESVKIEVPIEFEQPIKFEPDDQAHTSSEEVFSALKGAGDYKYGYEDIITGTFEEKLEECLSKSIIITTENAATHALNNSFYEDYNLMVKSDNYKKLKTFREILPTYKKSKELLEVINNNQVVVISGETGCGKSTQIPQIILDNGILNQKGAHVHILVTQPRRIAASSLAMRVAEERSEQLGVSVGYSVRLEKVEARPRGSIMFCTTGILLAELETNQGLTQYSHVILDEVHERDCHIDLSMLMLKQVISKRKDLKVILMSATIDAEQLAAYFDNCPMMHIEGLAYPVQDVYLEDILHMTKFTLPPEQPGRQNAKRWQRGKIRRQEAEMQGDIQYKAEIGPWLESIRKKVNRDVYLTLQNSKIEDINIDLIYELLVHICKGEAGAILVFLPGIGEITKLLKKIDHSAFFPRSRYEIHALHSKLPSLEQHKIFRRPPDHIRKIIVATNIAETSITIDDIVYVVDCGKIKYNGLNVEENTSTLKTEWISQANLRQRRGRAGRCQSGICYHLVTSYRATQLADRLLPEIQRNSLLEPVLAIKRLRLGMTANAMNMLPEPPAETTVQRAVKHLSQVGALDNAEKLTPLGWHLARLPVHPAAGKLLLLGAMFGCLNRAASVAAVWGFKDPFQLVIGKEKEVDEAKRSLAMNEPSDHVAISEAIIQFEECRSYQQKRKFAYDYFLAFNTLELLSDMKKQFGHNLKQMGFLKTADVTSAWENRNKYNMSVFKAIVAASLYPNIATARWRRVNVRNPYQKPSVKVRTPEGANIALHPSSVMASKTYQSQSGPSGPVCVSPGANWLVYWLKQRSSDLFLIDVTLVYTLPFLFFGELVLTEGNDRSNYCISISAVKVSCKKTTMKLLWEMRNLLDQVLAAKIGDSSKLSTRYSPFENLVLNAVKELITAEDECAEYIGDDDDNSESDHSESYRSWRR